MKSKLFKRKTVNGERRTENGFIARSARIRLSPPLLEGGGGRCLQEIPRYYGAKNKLYTV
jgi:hypothetical protein